MANELSVWPALAALAAVVAAIPATAWLLGRVPALRARRDGALAMVATLPLGARERVAIVRAGDRWLVLGITAAGVNLLTTLDAPPPGAPLATGPDACAPSAIEGAVGITRDTAGESPGNAASGCPPAGFAAQLERVLGALGTRRDAGNPRR